VIIDLPNTTVPDISKTLVDIRDEGGAVALGRVLTLIIVTTPEQEEAAIDAANAASREHPMRVLVLSSTPGTVESGPGRLDAQIRVGGDAGASEVIVIHGQGEAAQDQESIVTGLLLPDAPVVAWWSGPTPAKVSDSPIGRIATRRITDVATSGDPWPALESLAANLAPGDTDLAWTRTTLWRSQLAAVLDQPPYEPVTSVVVTGTLTHASVILIAAWLAQALEAPVTIVEPGQDSPGFGIDSVVLTRASGDTSLVRLTKQSARLTQPAQPPHEITIPVRTNRECLAEELRRLDPDEVFQRVVTSGLMLVDAATRTVES